MGLSLSLAYYVLTLNFSLATSYVSFQAAAQRTDPIIVNIGEPKDSDLIGLADVLLGSLGLTGVLVLASVLAAGVFAAVLFWIRSRAV